MRDPMNERPQPAASPIDSDGVICPDSYSKRILTPTKVYDAVENGKRVRRGVLPEHQHKSPYGGGFKDCDWAGHPSPIVQKPVEQKPSDKTSYFGFLPPCVCAIDKDRTFTFLLT